MDFSLTPEQQQIRDMVAEFVDEEVVPRASEIDETDEFPWDLVEEMSDLGLMGMPFPEEYDGAGLDYHSYAIALEEVSRGAAVSAPSSRPTPVWRGTCSTRTATTTRRPSSSRR